MWSFGAVAGIVIGLSKFIAGARSCDAPSPRCSAATLGPSLIT